ncbi:hypothetical protein [Clostridium sp. UBA1652]|uniref:hypothetical protein n=1 Tax=Clostridium sp. UBA1652 TaxID=1946348 RepID=UPI00257B26F4|nr:hypothetical protein [Clostridium sp. UBA1652]
MGSEIINFEAYHGTNKSSSESIMKSKYYIPSNKDNEWLGSGVYFFIDNKTEKSIENSIKWAVNFKGFKNYAVIKNNIEVDKDKAMDLNNEDWQDIFEAYKIEKIKDYKKRGIQCNMNVKQLDCMTINDICNEMKLDIVYQQRYIELGQRDKGNKLIASNIPNCRIMSVRKPEIIDKNSMYIIEEGEA